MRHDLDLSVYFVTDPDAPHGFIETASAAASGGATIVQLRHKGADRSVLVEAGLTLKTALSPFGVGLIINDDIQAAREIGAAGVHLGQSDADVRIAREMLGAEAIVGLSIDDIKQLPSVDWGAIDYVGAGPLRATATKPDHAQPIGLIGLRSICATARRPVVAIGGVTATDAAAIKTCGASGLAVVSAISRSNDPEAATRAIVKAWSAA